MPVTTVVSVYETLTVCQAALRASHRIKFSSGPHNSFMKYMPLLLLFYNEVTEI